MVVLDATVVNIALPSAQADLGFSDGDRQWVVTAYSLAFGSLLLLGGRLSDLIGRKRTFIIGLIGFAGASALGGAAQTSSMLVGARALQGAFGAPAGPDRARRADHDLHRSRGSAPARSASSARSPAPAAPSACCSAGSSPRSFNWRWNLYINVFIAAVAVVGAAFFVDPVDAHRPAAEARRARHRARLRRPVRPGLRLLERRDRRLGLAR